jgi:hypothetical protein
MSKIAIIIPTFNALPFMDILMENIVSDDFFQFYIVDDNSVDNTYNKLKDNYGFCNNVQIYKKPLNLQKGASYSRTYAVKFINEDFIYNLDQDDLLYHSEIKTIVDSPQNFNYDVVLTSIKIKKNNLKYIEKSVYSNINFLNKYLLRIYYPPRLSSLIVKKEILKDINFYPNVTSGGEEWLLFMKLFRRGPKILISNLCIVEKFVDIHNLSVKNKIKRLESYDNIVNENSNRFEKVLYKFFKKIKKIKNEYLPTQFFKS